MSLGRLDMVKKLSDFVSPALNKCFLPLEKGFDQHTGWDFLFSPHFFRG